MIGYLTVAESKAIAIAVGMDPKADLCVGEIRNPARRKAADVLADAFRQMERP